MTSHGGGFSHFGIRDLKYEEKNFDSTPPIRDDPVRQAKPVISIDLKRDQHVK